jgi:hypothetical protein
MAGALFFFGVLIGLPVFVAVVVRAYAKAERAQLIAKDAKGPDPDPDPPT